MNRLPGLFKKKKMGESDIVPITNNMNNFQAIPRAQEFNNPGIAIRCVALGICQAGIVRGFMDSKEAAKQAKAIIKHCDWRGDLGGVLGPSLFECNGDPIKYFNESQLAATRIDSALGGQPAKLYEAIESFESLVPTNFVPAQDQLPRIKPVVYKGKSAAYNRALVFDCEKANIVKIHEDLANVRALASYNFEIASTQIVLAHNLYLQNRKGEGSLFIYGKKFTEKEKKDLDKRIGLDQDGNPSQIFTTGYPYPESEFTNCPVTQIDVEAGDYVVFRADFPHKVATVCKPTKGYRVSWNGFFTLLYGTANELVYWT